MNEGKPIEEHREPTVESLEKALQEYDALGEGGRTIIDGISGLTDDVAEIGKEISAGPGTTAEKGKRQGRVRKVAMAAGFASLMTMIPSSEAEAQDMSWILQNRAQQAGGVFAQGNQQVELARQYGEAEMQRMEQVYQQGVFAIRTKYTTIRLNIVREMRKGNITKAEATKRANDTQIDEETDIAIFNTQYEGNPAYQAMKDRIAEAERNAKERRGEQLKAIGQQAVVEFGGAILQNILRR